MGPQGRHAVRPCHNREPDDAGDRSVQGGSGKAGSIPWDSDPQSDLGMSLRERPASLSWGDLSCDFRLSILISSTEMGLFVEVN